MLKDCWLPRLSMWAALTLATGYASAARAQDANKPKIVSGFTVYKDTIKFPPGYFWDSVRVKQNWPKLKIGLSGENVVRLLGHPNGCGISVGGELVIWAYGRREVVFNSVTMKVTGWDERTLKYGAGNAWRR